MRKIDDIDIIIGVMMILVGIDLALISYEMGKYYDVFAVYLSYIVSGLTILFGVSVLSGRL
jgi:hypothetical protein